MAHQQGVTELSIRGVVVLMVAGLCLAACSTTGRTNVPAEKTTTSPANPSMANATTSRTVTLPPHYWFDGMTPSGTQLLLTGTVPSTRPSAQCIEAALDPRTLAIGKVRTGSCNDPAMTGDPVELVTGYSATTTTATESVASVDPSTGAVTQGPVVMTYSYLSDTRPVTAYGDGFLWVYDVATTAGPEVLQISEATGTVVDTVAMPQLYRPVVAANDDGLWLGNSIDGEPESNALWHVVPGATSPVPVASPGLSHVFWLVGAGDHLWGGMGPTYLDQTIVGFEGPDAKVLFNTPDRGYDPTAVVGSESDGLWTAVPSPPFGVRLSPNDNKRQDIVHIDPDTGDEQVTTTISPIDNIDAEVGILGGRAAYVDGYFLLLQPPFRADGYLGFDHLVRVKG
jgi:hypothetical protein